MADYLKVIYDTKSHPQTTYPGKLCSYLFHTFQMQKGQKFLEPGCGRGEFLEEFNKLGLDCYGIDLSEYSGSLCPDVEVKKNMTASRREAVGMKQEALHQELMQSYQAEP